MEDLILDLSIGEECYKPMRTNRAINGNYIEHKSKGVKGKTLSAKTNFIILINL